MKAKSTTICNRDGSYPHVSQKSNKISKISYSMVQVTSEPVDLDTSAQTFQNGFKDEVSSKEQENDKNQMSHNGDVTLAQTCLLFDENSGSTRNMDSLPLHLPSSLITMISSLSGSNDVHCNPFDAVVREPITVAPQVDDNSSSNYQTSHVFDVLDSYIDAMCFTGIPATGIRVFDNNVYYNILSDQEFAGTNLAYNVSEEFMLLPSLEGTVEATDSHYGGSCDESKQMSENSWFHFICHQTKPFTQEFDVSPSHFGSGEVDYSDPESFIRNFLELSDNSLPALVGKETSKSKHITLVLDLDETLVHSTFKPCDGADFTTQLFFDEKEHTVYVRKRPFLEAFLKRVSEMFEVIIFTASQSIYADKLLDVLDTDRKLFSRRLYRESCIFLDGCYTKDLTILGIDLAKVAIIDNSPKVFRLQVDNGIPIKSWYDDASDTSLTSLLPFLETLADSDDVRPIIAKNFRIRD